MQPGSGVREEGTCVEAPPAHEPQTPCRDCPRNGPCSIHFSYQIVVGSQLCACQLKRMPSCVRMVVIPVLTGFTIFGGCWKIADGLSAQLGGCRELILVTGILFCSFQVIPLVVKQHISVLYFGDPFLFCSDLQAVVTLHCALYHEALTNFT